MSFLPPLWKNSPSLAEHINIAAACLAFILLDDEQQGRALCVVLMKSYKAKFE